MTTRLLATSLVVPFLFASPFFGPSASSVEQAGQTGQAAPAAPAKEAQNDIPIAAVPMLEGLAHQLAKAGREREMNVCVDVLEVLGQVPAAHVKLKTALMAELTKVKQAADSVPDAAKKCHQLAKTLVPLLSKREGAAKEAMAQAILHLDDTLDEAHLALGHEKVGAHWNTAEQKKAREQRGVIMEAARKASELEVDIAAVESSDETLVSLTGAKGAMAHRGLYTLQSAYSVEKTSRILREVMRAMALSNWLRHGGEVTLPNKGGGTARNFWYLLETKGQYLAAVERSLKNGDIVESDAVKYRELGSFGDKRGDIFLMPAFESEEEATLLVFFIGGSDGVATALRAGQLNWLALAMLGTQIPNLTYTNKGQAPKLEETHVAESAADKKLREERLLLAKAGLLGARNWMIFLAERGEDPAFSECLYDQLGKIRNEELQKCTSIVEFLQETERYAPLYKSIASAKSGKPAELYAKALDMSMSELETHWREWLLPSRGGLAQRLDKQTEPVFPADSLAVVSYIEKLRERAFDKRVTDISKLTLDKELCDNTEKHVRYLLKNKEQSVKWPDAHEEYREREGYSPEGAWAGTHSDVYVGKDDIQDAVDGWMGTFYHRLPFIDPGLVRIGWFFDGGISVCDVGSYVKPVSGEWSVAWPYDGMTGVPVAFERYEWPNPVPENTEQDYGYPITLQVGRDDPLRPPVEIDMKLMDGKNEVPCWYSTPSKPTNPKLAPSNAYCLLPKTSLKPHTTYTVTAEWAKTGAETGVVKKITWTFKT